MIPFNEAEASLYGGSVVASSFDLPLSEGSIENGVITRSAVPPAISKSIA